jgi:hypothetical protein
MRRVRDVGSRPVAMWPAALRQAWIAGGPVRRNASVLLNPNPQRADLHYASASGCWASARKRRVR